MSKKKVTEFCCQDLVRGINSGCYKIDVYYPYSIDKLSKAKLRLVNIRINHSTSCNRSIYDICPFCGTELKFGLMEK